jgi:hypothetical protein
MARKNELENQLDAVYASDVSELEKLSRSFELVTANYLAEYAREIEMNRAIQDEDRLLKARIQHGMIESARGMFAHCYLKSTGKPAWRD